ncbi:MAG: SDR family NAD(P)-dependent oxidoreductase [Pseudomonadales bacterium]
MSIRFDGRVAIVTGAGNGLGKSHALELARRGAKVVVNDLGGSKDGTGSSDAAEQVVAEIKAAGGEAMANGANVADFDAVQAMVAEAKSAWGSVDILVNNAGILRDKSFAKGTLEDFRLVLEVHLMGTVNCTKAVWELMREQEYGRIVVTTSSSGMYGNFGQANYGSAKMGVLGLMNTLVQEGAKYNIRVNALSPCAATRMTEGLLPDDAWALLNPEAVTPGLICLVAEDAPNRTILAAGAGTFAQTIVYETDGINLQGEALTAENVAANWAAISSPDEQKVMNSGADQTVKFVSKAMENQG